MATVGETLREARTAKGLTLEDVHARIGIPVHYLQAMEGGAGRLIADEFYLVPFLRRYAELLEVDPANLVARFLNEAVRRDDAHRIARPAEGGAGLPMSVGVAAAVVVVAGVLGWFLLSGGGGSGTGPTEPVPSASATASALPAP